MSPGEHPIRLHRHRWARLAEINGLTLAEAAARYVWSGIPIFPLQPGDKRPGVRHGLKDASTDAELVLAWWRKHPEDNIGIPTGAATFDVLDVDHKHGNAPGIGSFLALRGQGLAVHSWAVQSTPSGGMHVLWAPGGLGNTTRARIGLDVRGDGGYIVAAPSVIDGRSYRWERVEVARFGEPMPWGRIVALLDPPRHPTGGHGTTTGGIDRLRGWLAAQVTGNRNSALHWAACRAVEADLDPGQLAPVAEAIGLPRAEVARTIASARREGHT